MSLLSTRSEEARLLQRPWSITVALLSLAEWISLGWGIPLVKEIHAGFRVDASDFAWFYPYWIVMSFHWVWCIPVGVLLAAGVLLKDGCCPPPVARRINLVVFWAGIMIWAACVFVAFTPVHKVPMIRR